MTEPRTRRPIVTSLPFAAIALVVLATAAWTPRPAPFARSTAIAGPKPLRGNPAPSYPAALRAAGAEGRVVVAFLTNERGIPDSATIRIVETTNDGFAAAVLDVVPHWRFDSPGVVKLAVKFFLTDPDGRDPASNSASADSVDGASMLPVVVTALGKSRRPSGGTQQPDFPNTPAGRAFKEWFEAFNSGSRARIDAFSAKYPIGEGDGIARGAAGMAQLQSESAPFDLLAIRDSKDLNLDFVVRERSSGLMHVGYFAITGDMPARGASFRLLQVNRGRTVDDPGLLSYLHQMRP